MFRRWDGSRGAAKEGMYGMVRVSFACFRGLETALRFGPVRPGLGPSHASTVLGEVPSGAKYAVLPKHSL